MLKQYIGLLLIVCVIADSGDNKVVLDMLDSLKVQSQSESSRLEKVWGIIKADKEGTILDLDSSRMEQAVECQSKQNDVNGKQIEISDANDYVNWMKQRTSNNNLRIQILSEATCKGNVNYVNGISSSKQTLAIIQYLRGGLVNQQQSELLQINQEHTINHIHDIVKVYQDYKHGKISPEFLQSLSKTLSAQDSEETTVEQLIQLFDAMEDQLSQDMSDVQDAEVETGVTLADFKAQLERENQIFITQIDSKSVLVEHFKGQLISLKSKQEACYARLHDIEVALGIGRQDLVDSEEAHKVLMTSVQGDVDLYDELYRIYSAQVVAPEQTVLMEDSQNEAVEVDSEVPIVIELELIQEPEPSIQLSVDDNTEDENQFFI